jgi:hypothetical protein
VSHKVALKAKEIMTKLVHSFVGPHGRKDGNHISEAHISIIAHKRDVNLFEEIAPHKSIGQRTIVRSRAEECIAINTTHHAANIFFAT